MHEFKWVSALAPRVNVLTGAFCSLEPLSVDRHAQALWESFQGRSTDPHLWDYLAYGPFANPEEFDVWLARQAVSKDPHRYAVIHADTGRAVGTLSLMNIALAHGSVEIGHVIYGATMQRTPIATEAVYLLAREAFETLGNRRLEWKCDSGNVRSKRAAQRLGFSYEGTFRQHMVIKDRNRDTAWFSIIDKEWPRIRAGFECWLSEANFDQQGMQKRTLESLR
jgi:RimJ/RimL family protein N-acetyltransferase